MSEVSDESISLPPAPELRGVDDPLPQVAGRIQNADFLTIITYTTPEYICSTGLLVRSARLLDTPYHVKPVRTIDAASNAFRNAARGAAIGVGVPRPSNLPSAPDFDGEIPEAPSLTSSSGEDTEEDGEDSGATKFMDGGEEPTTDAPTIDAVSLTSYEDSTILSAYRLATLLREADDPDVDARTAVTGLVSATEIDVESVKNRDSSLPDTAHEILDSAADEGIEVQPGIGVPSRRMYDITLLTSIYADFSGVPARDEEVDGELISKISIPRDPNQGQKKDVEEFVRNRTGIDSETVGIRPIEFTVSDDVMTADGFSELLRVIGRCEAGTAIGIAGGLLERDEYIGDWRRTARRIFETVHECSVNSESGITQVDLGKEDVDIAPLVGRVVRADVGGTVMVSAGPWVCILASDMRPIRDVFESWGEVQYGFAGEFAEVNAENCAVTDVIDRVHSVFES